MVHGVNESSWDVPTWAPRGSTFLIDPQGTIVDVWEQVKPAGHPGEVLGALRVLSRF